MKQINLYFEDEEFDALTEQKGEMTWREFILTLVKNREETIAICNKYNEVENGINC